MLFLSLRTWNLYLWLATWDLWSQAKFNLSVGIDYFTLSFLVPAGVDLMPVIWFFIAVAALRQKLDINGVADGCQIYFEDNRKVSTGEIYLLTIQSDFPHILTGNDFQKISISPQTKHDQLYCLPSSLYHTKYHSHIEWFYSGSLHNTM